MDYSRNGGVDLHVHSSASDGTLSPRDILLRAESLGLKAVSITDHDTIDGVKSILADGVPAAVAFLPGVEISALPPDGFKEFGSIHILGYGVDPAAPRLNAALRILQTARKDRNPRIIRRLADMGIDLNIEEALRLAGDGQPGRPHIARLLVEKGHAASINDAFDRFIGKGMPAYVDKYRVSCREAVDIIADAGGLPVLAHPFLLDPLDAVRFEKMIADLTAMGLRGVEAYYPEHTPEQVALCLAVARRRGLLATGGTDFHGAVKPDVEMGVARGGFYVPWAVYERLAQTLSDASSPCGSKTSKPD